MIFTDADIEAVNTAIDQFLKAPACTREEICNTCTIKLFLSKTNAVDMCTALSNMNLFEFYGGQIDIKELLMKTVVLSVAMGLELGMAISENRTLESMFKCQQ